ncbi:Vacuolar protein sorting-associated protein 8 [Pleurotus ostreatus]|uniref:Vacuolar protein sorting-associated protein 8 n=1 Tax=Pleurotus ostreatus TaxID=5322 RepID=A0A8H6ZRW6_PLEOS|nr:Vacuolar protein sorting-associated protein 8 [Pleurotus ostreatus]KAF7428647.1 Vacuolar protein sorting-associated protein 8 [Pleurotus ostreatus]
MSSPHSGELGAPARHLDDGPTSSQLGPLEFLESDDAEEFEYEGDYDTRMAELMSEGGDDAPKPDSASDEEDGFVYDGVDADVPTSYSDQLRAVLGPEHESEDDTDELDEVETSLIIQDSEKPMQPENESFSDATPSTSSVGLPGTPPRTETPSKRPLSSQLFRSYIHPSVSRLRSFTPQSSRVQSPGSGMMNSHSLLFNSQSLSRASSSSNLHSQSSERQEGSTNHDEREVFRWTQLRNITTHLYSHKASSVMGNLSLGSPTTLAANGLICIGTDEGKVCVYDFQQDLKCICGDEGSPLSHDHTYVVSGHATGYIQLYDLKNPRVPARTVAPTTLASVASGRQEGHLQGSRIVSVGFIAGRHTAIVSADEHGLAFSHSLGKVLFVEAPDILRILGTYAVEEAGKAPLNPLLQRRRARFTVLAMMPLPLGTSPHPTDAYNIIALLTPKKLVVVSLKPTPKTWFKCTREDVRGSRRRGAMSWYPSVVPGAAESSVKPSSKAEPGTIPVLAYSWGKTLYFIKVFESGNLVHEAFGKWSADSDILALQWLNSKQIVVMTATTLEVFDITLMKTIERVERDALSLVSPTLGLTVRGALSYADAAGDVAHSIRVYKGKIFMLGRETVEVGTLLTWADLILTYVENGQFLQAIDLAKSYYVGEAPGNKNGLPEDEAGRKEITGQRVRDLMVASARYAFSEERMTDSTHVTSDGRGVDRTSLFEGLVVSCAQASIALDNFDFFFEDLFQYYDDAGISRIFLLQLEPFILDNDIRFVPPRITQKLVALHDEGGRPDLVERVIWHIDPACLDINQAIHLCQRHQLYDALIYVYSSALRDYVAPIVELLGLIRKIQRMRIYGFETSIDEDDIESTMAHTYKVYGYLANALAGLSYPAGQSLDTDDASRAKSDIYGFVFSGRSIVWPPGEGGDLVLTSTDEDGVEPTYPYVRLLLEYDAESFLHSLDIAFEDGYLNNESQGVSRLLIVKILLELLSSGDLSQSDTTFINIFIARNVPKYPQFLQLAPSALHNVLIALTEDPDPSSREDRQLAAEYLLSAYTPHDSDSMAIVFRIAGFYRILRTWHRQEQQWVPWLTAILDDPDFRPAEVFSSVEDVISSAVSPNGDIPPEVDNSISDALPRLLQSDIQNTVQLLQKHLPHRHTQAVEELGKLGRNKQYDYLCYLFGPPRNDDSESWVPAWTPGSKVNIPSALVQQYISLHCEFHPDNIVAVLQYLPESLLDWDRAVESCETHEAFDAAVWALNRHGDPQKSLSKAEGYEQQVMIKILKDLSSPSEQERGSDLDHQIDMLQSIARTTVGICLAQSRSTDTTDVPLEDIWFQVLGSQISCVQRVSSFYTRSTSDGDATAKVERAWKTLSSLRLIVQDTFSSLVSVTSTRAVSFPRLFKRLVNSASRTELSSGAHYDEFRSILTGMLESYRSDGDILTISKHLVDRDLFETVSEATRERMRGWAAPQMACAFCRQSLFQTPQKLDQEFLHIVVSRTGTIYHRRCLPQD